MTPLEYALVAVVYLGLGYVVCFKWTQGVKPLYNVIGLLAVTVLVFGVYALSQ